MLRVSVMTLELAPSGRVLRQGWRVPIVAYVRQAALADLLQWRQASVVTVAPAVLAHLS